MKRSKQAKALKRKDGVDLISNLPDHILQLILSRIPSTEELVRTSILSRKWRYLWTSIPSIDIDYTRGLNPLKEFKRNKFREFIYWVLQNKPLNLDSFRLWCSDNFNMSTVRQWIHVAVMRKVKLLDLKFCPKEESEDIELPNSLVTCGSLEVLRLCFLGYHLSLPTITGFPALRVLELNDVELKESDSVKYFLDSCPLLEDLSVIDCLVHESQGICISSVKLKNLRIENHHEETKDFEFTRKYHSIEITCPKLIFLKLTGNVTCQFLFESLYSLKEAVIDVVEFFDLEEPTYDFFDGISHVEFLSITYYCVSMCFDPRVDTHVSLPNLKTLELRLDSLYFMFKVIPFLKCLPHLESLHLILPKLDDTETVSVLTRQLKIVKFLEFCGGNQQLELARALLEHANKLEEMVFMWSDGAKFHERSMETLDEVSKFHKASSTAKLRFVINRPDSS